MNLEDEFYKYLYEEFDPKTKGKPDEDDMLAFARHFADWQKEQMMKNSTDAYICRNRYTKTNVLHLDVTCDTVQGFKDNDKLKAIFIKED